MTGRAGAASLLCALAAGLGLCAPAAAQQAVTVAPGPQYRASDAHEFLLGDDYRDLWYTPVRVEVLDLRTFGGGLRATELGGGNQTESLRFRGGDGREYQFRSMDKEFTKGLPEDLKETLVDRVLQDQVSSLVPGAGPVSARFHEALGLLHARPRLVVLPDDPALGEWRRQFAGRLGSIEERPDDAEDQAEGGGPAPGFAGAEKVKGTEEFLEDLEDDPEHRVDSREWLAGRLLDLFLGDWDRHEDQYRWARFTRGGLKTWRPIPRDRDYAMVDYDGQLLRIGRTFIPKAVQFRETYPKSLVGLVINGQFLDRRFLSDVPRPAWDSVARAVQARLSDEVIEDALRRMPPEHYALRGAELGRIFRARRDALPEVSAQFYRMLALEPEVRATDKPERAVVRRLPGGGVEVALHEVKDGEPARAPYYRRTFSPAETREVRIFLQGGDDQAVVEGASDGGIKVRVIGGGGDDRMEDRGRGARTLFYDDRGENLFVRGEGTRVDERSYESPEWQRGGLQDPPRDWGGSSSLLRPYGGWRSNVGVIVGGGPAMTRYGFRRHPWARRSHLRVLWAPLETRFGVELLSEARLTGTDHVFRLDARATELEPTRFHGFGNDTERRLDGDLYRVWQRLFTLEPSLDLALNDGRTRVAFGPVLRYTVADPEAGSPAETLDPRGIDEFLQAGARVEASLERRDFPAWARKGLFLGAGASAYPLVTDEIGAFGEAHAEALGYVPVPLPLETTLALRLGGKRVFGEFPFQEAAFLGGSRDLRGHHGQRFAGDASLYGSAEARVFLTRAKLFVRGDLGVFGLADAGRVWYEGDSEGGWHSALGGGVWFSFLDRTRTLSASYAYGEKGMFYVRMGLPF